MIRRDVKILALVALSFAMTLSTDVTRAQTPPTPPPAAQGPAAQNPVAPKAIKPGDILSGELNAMRGRGKGKGKAKRISMFQLVSAPRQLPAPGGLCNLETGPETFQIVTTSDAQAAQLKRYVGKAISLKIDEIACAEAAGVMSEAVVTKWSLVAKP